MMLYIDEKVKITRCIHRCIHQNINIWHSQAATNNVKLNVKVNRSRHTSCRIDEVYYMLLTRFSKSLHYFTVVTIIAA